VDVEKGYDVVAKLRQIGQRVGGSPAQVALSWLLTRDFVTTILVGASSIKQLDENLKAADLRLPADDVAALDEATRPPARYPGWMQPLGLDAKVKAAFERE
jgi:aryl-alcohol dehydrogenase-like predicted oxidoreductase